MKKWFFLAIILIVFIFEVTLLNYFKIFNIKPDLLLITVIIASLIFDLKWALIYSLLAGILKDIFTANMFGINTLLFPFWSFFIIKLSKKISIDNNFIRAVLIFIIGICNAMLTRLIFFYYLGKLIPLGIFLNIAFLGSLYTAFISPLVFKIIKPALYS